MEEDNTKIPDEFAKDTKKPEKQKTPPVDDEYTAELKGYGNKNILSSFERTFKIV